MTTITIDIETLPDLRDGAREKFIDAALQNVKVPPGSTKETLAADLGINSKDDIKSLSRSALDALWLKELGEKHAEEKGDDEWRKTSFSGLSGHLLMIGVGIDDQEPKVITGDEKTILEGFADALESAHKLSNFGIPMIVGHNVIDFDLQFIFHRSVMVGVKPHPIMPVSPSRYSDQIYDTMTRWAGFGNRIKLDDLAQALGLGSKEGMDGSKVYDFYKEGRNEEIVEYCAQDVRLTRDVYKRMTFQSSLD